MNRSVIEHATREPQYLTASHSVSDLSLPLSNDTLNTKNQNRPGQILSRILKGVGPTLILVGFAAVFYYGHQNDWKLPKFGALTGNAKVVVQDWCEEHSVPESNCVQCDPSLMPEGPDYGWCDEHGVHNCPLHHPDIAQLKSTPVVDQADFERAARALAVAPRIENNRECKFYRSRIQFASVESVRQAGVDVELVDRGRIVESIHGSGSIVYDPTRMANLASRASGSVWTVRKNVGDKISRGDTLAIVDAAEVGNYKTALMRSLTEKRLQERNVGRLTAAKDAIPGSLLLNAQAALSKARADVLSAEQSLRNLGLKVQLDELSGSTETQIMDQLRFLDIPPDAIASINGNADSSNLIPIVSPIDGIVIDRAVSAGEVVDSSKILFKVADISQMWLMLSVSLEHARRLEMGQIIEFRSDAVREVVNGKIDWISTTADKTTRMIQVRAVLDNRSGRLRNETFGTGEIILRYETHAIVIPSGASHWEGCCQVVFVRDKGYFDSPESYKVFHVRSVRLGATQGKFTEVISGVLPGEVIATTGSDVLRAQLLKNNLGAGCDCVAE